VRPAIRYTPMTGGCRVSWASEDRQRTSLALRRDPI
jgi:hypothetical protein